MVTCEASAVGEGSARGFRLGARGACEGRGECARASPPPRRPAHRTPSVSSVSLYKQKIDALFDDTRSIGSGYGPNLSELTRQNSKVSSTRGNRPPIFENEENNYCQNKIKQINNTVQDRIERMFADMARDAKGPLADAIGIHTFSVHYLGSTPLQHKVTSLSGLQVPLKDLYFAYRKNFRHKNTLTGRLEISKSGLKVRYKGEKGDLEQLNPFPTIAVWSAVKFVVQAAQKENNILSYAFLPLITDPDNIDRHLLFKTLEQSDKKYILSHNENPHSPLFAVVMRKIGVAKQLECHGFVCQSSEDAIVIAATLYKSLMSHMNRQNHNDPTKKKRLKNRNGVSCMSIASSTNPRNDIPVRPPRKKRSTSSLSGDSDRPDTAMSAESLKAKPKLKRSPKDRPEMQPPPPPPPSFPPRPTVEEVKAKLDEIRGIHDTSSSSDDPREVEPKKSIVDASIEFLNNQAKTTNSSSNDSSVRSKVSEKIELFTELEKKRNIQRPPTLPPPIPVKPTDSSDEIVKEPLRRNHSGRQSLNDSGDILTKVAIPRSGSFLNAGGLTRYKSIGHRNNGKKGGGSPLGFNELFNEFRVQENLNSMDEILNAIIDAEGMSFNDLKPIYKEFLLKLAVTLTKDELFQHSKAIMKKQKKKILRRNSTFQNKRKKMFKGANGLRMVFRLPFGKELKKKDKKNLKNFEFQSLAANMKNLLASESSVSTSSYDIHQFRPKETSLPPPKRQTVRKRTTKRTEKVVHVSKRNGKVLRPGERTSTSEDSDFLTLSGRLGQNRNSSSGYVSCSECESESCADRCYCSLRDDCKSKCYCSAAELRGKECPKARLRAKTKNKNCKDCVNRESACDSCSFCCSCDSASCNDSGKCYCPRPPNDHTKVNHRTSTSVKSSRSLEYLKSPCHQLYSDRLRRAFEPMQFEQKPKIQPYRTRSSSVADGRWAWPGSTAPGSVSVRVGGSSRERRARSTDNLALDYELFLNARDSSRQKNMQRLTVRSSGGAMDALSVKKSAEMAALFADVHLAQRTDVRALRPRAQSTRAKRPVAPSVEPPLPPLIPAHHKENRLSHRPSLPSLVSLGSDSRRPLARPHSLEDSLGYLP